MSGGKSKIKCNKQGVVVGEMVRESSNVVKFRQSWVHEFKMSSSTLMDQDGSDLA